MPQQSTVLKIEATPHAQRQKVLQLMHLGNARIERLLAAADCGKVDMQGLFHARRGNTFVGAAWGQVTPGRSAFCWPANIEAGEREETADLLQSALDQHLDSVGVAVTQAILPSQNILDVLRLTRAGYRHLADLNYLVSEIERFPPEKPSSTLAFLPSGRGGELPIKELIDHTYQDTLDCTDLDGVRSTDDVLTGYRHTGVFRPQWWIIAQHQGEDVGCVLLADHPEHNQCELMYLGIVPGKRGRCWGYQLTKHAQWLARCADRQRIVLAVDDMNWPARDLYERAGFELWDQRSVYVRTAYSDGTSSPSLEP